MAIIKTTKDEKVIINRDFSINVPGNMAYSTDKREINENRLFVAIKEEQNDYYIEEFGEDCEFSISSPFAAPRCIVIQVGQNFAQQFGNALDLTNEGIRGTLTNMAEQMLVMMGGDVKKLKDDDNLIVYYTEGDMPDHFISIITPSGLYPGQIWLNDIKDKKDRIKAVKKILNSVEIYTLRDEDKIPSPKFEPHTYNEGKRSHMGKLTAAVPDGMVTLAESVEEKSVSVGSSADMNAMMEEFAFLAMTKDYEGGFHECRNAPYAIHCKNEGIQIVDVLNGLWESSAKERENKLKAIVRQGFDAKGRGGSELCYKELDKQLAVVYGRVGESGDPIEYWESYGVYFFYKEEIHQVMIFINAQKDEAAFKKSVDDWVMSVKPASEDQAVEFEKKNRIRALGQFAAEDGQIDAIKVSQLFSKDVFFNNDDEITYDGKHNNMTGLQANAETINQYPQIIKNAAAFVNGIADVVHFVEENENLMIPKAMFSRELLEVTRKRPITGTTVFDLCAWHMITIVENAADDYMIAVDQNLIKGIPACDKFIAEYVQTLRQFNGKTGNFKLELLSTMVLDTPIDYIDTPVLGAVAHESMYVLDIKAGEHPYEGVCKNVTDLKKMEKIVKKELKNAGDSAEWDVKILNNGTFGITSYKGKSEEVSVPAEFEGYTVSAICEEAFSQYKEKLPKAISEVRKNIKQIRLPETINTIEDNAFYGCSNLTEIVVPNSVERIGAFAFGFCDKLQKVKMPDGKVELGSNIFSFCRKISDCIFANSGETLCYYPDTKKDSQYQVPNGVKHIIANAFSSDALERVIIPESVEVIDDNAFQCSGLKEIVMPERFVKTETFSFGCPNLEKPVYNKSKTVLYMYPAKSNETKVVIPESVEKICSGAFWNNEIVTDVYLSEDVKEIEYAVFSTWQEGRTITVHGPANSYAEHYVKSMDDEKLLFKAEGIAKEAYEADDVGGLFDFDELISRQEKQGWKELAAGFDAETEEQKLFAVTPLDTEAQMAWEADAWEKVRRYEQKIAGFESQALTELQNYVEEIEKEADDRIAAAVDETTMYAMEWEELLGIVCTAKKIDRSLLQKMSDLEEKCVKEIDSVLQKYADGKQEDKIRGKAAGLIKKYQEELKAARSTFCIEMSPYALRKEEEAKKNQIRESVSDLMKNIMLLTSYCGGFESVEQAAVVYNSCNETPVAEKELADAVDHLVELGLVVFENEKYQLSGNEPEVEIEKIYTEDTELQYAVSLAENASKSLDLESIIQEANENRNPGRFDRLNENKNNIQGAEERRKTAEAEAEKRFKKRENVLIVITAIIIVLLIVGSLFLVNTIQKFKIYNLADKLETEECFVEAIGLYKELGEFKDCPERATKAEKAKKDAELRNAYDTAITEMNYGNYEEAIKLFEQLGDYMDSEAKVEEAKKLAKKQLDDNIAAYDKDGESESYFEGNRERFELVSDSELKKLLVGQWTFSVSSGNDYIYTFNQDGNGSSYKKGNEDDFDGFKWLTHEGYLYYDKYCDKIYVDGDDVMMKTGERASMLWSGNEIRHLKDNYYMMYLGDIDDDSFIPYALMKKAK